MLRILLIITTSLMIGISMHSKDILKNISKLDLKKIESQAIKKGRKLLKIPKEKPLYSFVYFAVYTSDCLSQDSCSTVTAFLNDLKLWDRYRCYVFDDSLNIVTMAIEKRVFQYTSTMLDNVYIKYIKKLNPEYVFDYISSARQYSMIFCYKDGEIIIVSLSDDGKNIISYPLSELKDWKWLHRGKME